MAGAGLPAGVRLAVSGCDKFSFFFASTDASSSQTSFNVVSNRF